MSKSKTIDDITLYSAVAAILLLLFLWYKKRKRIYCCNALAAGGASSADGKEARTEDGTPMDESGGFPMTGGGDYPISGGGGETIELEPVIEAPNGGGSSQPIVIDATRPEYDPSLNSPPPQYKPNPIVDAPTSPVSIINKPEYKPNPSVDAPPSPSFGDTPMQQKPTSQVSVAPTFDRTSRYTGDYMGDVFAFDNMLNSKI